MTSAIGQPRVRVDGPRKVSGTAPYAYEQPVENPLYLYPVVSTIARGRVLGVDMGAALQVPGVELVLTNDNAPKLLVSNDPTLKVLQSPEIHYWGQFVGAVVAQSPQAAREAAGLVRVSYEETPHDADFRVDHPEQYPPKGGKGKAESQADEVSAAMSRAAFTVDEWYSTPTEHHNPMEPHPLTAIWTATPNPLAKHLTLYDSNQGTFFLPIMLGPLLGLLPNQIEVISPYVGGSFGTKGMPHPHVILTILAAKMLPGRAVKFAMTRQQMFHTTGYRPASKQRVRLAADERGRLLGIGHDGFLPTARVKEYNEALGGAAELLYAAPSREITQRLVPLDVPPATFMRAPGEFGGNFALEVAMDELADQAGLDPIELRLLNEPSVHPTSGKPFSTRQLVGCWQEGARLFGWERRGAVRSRRQGEWWLGMGMASASFPHVHVFNSRARIRYRDGRYRVELQASDLGTGAYTVIGQMAADALGVSADVVDVEIGRTGLPMAMSAGGSMGTHTWGSAVTVAGLKFREKFGANPKNGASLTAAGKLPDDYKKYARDAYGAHFAEVKVSEVTGEVRVTRMLGVYAAGRIINPRTATGQFVGGMTMGISAALHEESVLDPRFGHVVNADFAGYHIAAHADIVDIQARWLEEFDPYFGPTGAKGIGEISVVGVPAAISNAIYNATGKRLRDLPFTPDKVLG